LTASGLPCNINVAAAINRYAICKINCAAAIVCSPKPCATTVKFHHKSIISASNSCHVRPCGSNGCCACSLPGSINVSQLIIYYPVTNFGEVGAVKCSPHYFWVNNQRF